MRFSGIGVLVVGLGVLWVSAVQAQQVGFTQADRERVVRIETMLQMFMESTNQRFEQVNQRFAERLSFLQIIMGIFTVIMVAAIGFAFWDRPHEHFQSEGNHA
jgi:nitrate reductase NapE component